MCRFLLVISGTPSNPEAQSTPPCPALQIKTLNCCTAEERHHQVSYYTKSACEKVGKVALSVHC
jgi:hypothetical protein